MTKGSSCLRLSSVDVCLDLEEKRDIFNRSLTTVKSCWLANLFETILIKKRPVRTPPLRSVLDSPILHLVFHLLLLPDRLR
jgi:hypothetical protein